MSKLHKNVVEFPPKDAKGVALYLVGIVVVASLGFWWYTSGLPISTWIGGFSAQESSEERSSSETSPVRVAQGSGSNASPSNLSGKNDVASIVASLPSVSSFRSYFTSTGVAATINPNSTSPYTVFVPTNSAIARLTQGTISGLSAPEKSRFAKYHVIAGREVDVDAVRSGQILSLSGDMLNFEYGTDRVARVNGAAIIGTYHASNGVVYVIDGVLLPPKSQF